MIRVVTPTRQQPLAREVEGIVTDLSGDTITDDTPTVTVVCQEAGISLVMISEILFAPPLLESSCGDIGEEISLAYTYVM